MLELSEERAFHDLLNIQRRDRSLIWREMRDAEFVLRYFTFRDTWDTFSGGMQRHMDEFMARRQYADAAVLEEMRQDFLATVSNVQAAFGEHAFQRWVPSSGQWRRQVLAALFDAQMFACRGQEREVLLEKREPILSGMQELFRDAEFLASVDAATNTPSYSSGALRECGT